MKNFKGWLFALLMVSSVGSAFAATCSYSYHTSDGTFVRVEVEGDVCVASSETGRCQCS